MKLSTKAFFLLLSFSGSLCILLATLIFSNQRSKIDHDHTRKNIAMTEMIGNTLTEMESVVDRLMKGALEHIYFIDQHEGIKSTERLTQIRDQLVVSDIFITDREGHFDLVTNGELPPDQPTLFSFCKDYRNLTHGHMNIAITPIVMALPKGKGTYKFMMMPNHDRSRILEVGMKLDFIVRILQQSAQAYPELLSLGLYTPSGDSLGEYSAENAPATRIENLGTIGDAHTEVYKD